MRSGLAWCVAIGLAVGGCSSEAERGRTAGGALFDGTTLKGWRVLSGGWSAADGAMVGVGSRARIVCEGGCPASYRLRFEVAPRGSSEVSWAVAVPVGATCVLGKGLLYFAGGPEDWGEAWQAVEVEVTRGTVTYRFPGLKERTGDGTGKSDARFGDLALAQALWKAGFRFHERPDGLAVLALPPETWSPGSVSFTEGEKRGRKSLDERRRGGIVLVVPCTTRDGRDVAEDAGVRFRNVVVEPLE